MLFTMKTSPKGLNTKHLLSESNECYFLEDKPWLRQALRACGNRLVSLTRGPASGKGYWTPSEFRVNTEYLLSESKECYFFGR
jgi:hypothetical protein